MGSSINANRNGFGLLKGQDRCEDLFQPSKTPLVHIEPQTGEYQEGRCKYSECILHPPRTNHMEFLVHGILNGFQRDYMLPQEWSAL